MLERVFLAHRAWIGIELGTPDAATCAALALEALEGDRLLHEAGRRAAYAPVVRTLVMTDRPEEAQRAIAAMRDEATARGSLRLQAGASWYASNLALRSGQVAEDQNHARLALDLVDDRVDTFTGGAVVLLVYTLIERGGTRRRPAAAAPGSDSTTGRSTRVGDRPGPRGGAPRGWRTGDFERLQRGAAHVAASGVRARSRSSAVGEDHALEQRVGLAVRSIAATRRARSAWRSGKHQQRVERRGLDRQPRVGSVSPASSRSNSSAQPTVAGVDEVQRGQARQHVDAALAVATSRSASRRRRRESGRPASKATVAEPGEHAPAVVARRALRSARSR